MKKNKRRENVSKPFVFLNKKYLKFEFVHYIKNQLTDKWTKRKSTYMCTCILY